uniref:Uncharacterized protein n=1 Tax=Rhizophora mucronata TaxID=61149 RepID=A0A2P2KSF3_RHIMU
MVLLQLTFAISALQLLVS